VVNFIVATAGWLIKPTRRRVRVVELATPRSSSSSADASPGWLSRHSSRPLHGAKPHEPYIDLGPLELSRRH
jgi:hypothetical protein